MGKPDEKWYEVSAFFRADSEKVVEHKGERIFLCGEVGDVTIIRIQEVYGNENATVARIKAAQEMMQVMGIDKGIVVTDAVKFMRLNEVVDEGTIQQLNSGKMTVH